MPNLFYSIFQNDILPFFYLYDSNDTLLQCAWMIDKNAHKSINLNYTFKKWNHFDEQLQNYFNRELKTFNINIDPLNNESLKDKVLNIIYKIPYGKTVSYKEIGEMVNSRGYRAIGQVCRINKLPLVIPCHRVVGKNNLGGYMGRNEKSVELFAKKKLLELEGII